MRKETANILSLLDSYSLPTPEDIALKIAGDFRRRRIEKGITRGAMAEKSGVAIANIARFEQKGLISFGHLIELAIALGYSSELKAIFSEPKFSTMEELEQIKRNVGKKKAYSRKTYDEKDR
jgi:transcriptional regulator with XRE-family HTH domain